MKFETTALLCLSLLVMVSCHPFGAFDRSSDDHRTAADARVYGTGEAKGLNGQLALRDNALASHDAARPLIKKSKFIKLRPYTVARAAPITGATGKQLFTAPRGLLREFQGFTMPSPTDLNRGMTAGDQIRITVFREDDLSNIFTVATDGTIHYPLLGDINVAGVTPLQLAHLLRDRLRGDYLLNPHVNVSRVDYCALAHGAHEGAAQASISSSVSDNRHGG